ncbi:MAG: hypothetical protein AABX12_01620 [Nanoarchaeota archaeon]
MYFSPSLNGLLHIEGEGDCPGILHPRRRWRSKHNLFASGSVNGRYFVGGLIGTAGDYHLSYVENSYSVGRVQAISQSGGLIGYSPNASILNSYWDINTSGQSQSAGGEGRTTQQMQTQSNYVEWDFMNIWRINQGQDYPRLAWQP